ncbi:hypothetical protein FOZ60_015026 [Perkinsus olseni]|uniref:Uncharacterized protein n=1 Tax=Perkinsus olseni TaxID=32597 RepID=A0A7J6P6P6_PEROL|nr:hypothetical protein FOZ60_015026 [Perkinsus olseni]
MSTKQLTMVASAAVALVSNLPLGNAIGRGAPGDDFIPLVENHFSWKDYRTICMHERGKEYTDNWESLDVHVSKGIGVRTRYIACPKTDEWDAFRIQFDWAEPGTDAGSDPLSSLDDSTFRERLNAVEPYARRERSGTGDFANFKSYILIGEPICSLVSEAMEREHGTFINLCRKYYPLRRK